MKSFSELTSASQVNNEDLVAISQTSGSGYASKKTTVKDITDKSNLNLAEEYDSTSTYAVDDYVIYESVLYKCIGTTTGTFDSTKWTSVVVTDEMGSGGGGGTGGHTIIDENGNSMTARAGLQFVGGANVSDDATNNKTIVDLASAGGIDGGFIDTNNVVKDDFISDGTAHTWIATEDCILAGILIANSQNSGAYISIDGIDTFVTYEYTNGNGAFISVKKGQTIEYRAKSGSSFEAYGIQTGTTHSKFQPIIYSTEEQKVGVWKDGKPLYSKIVDIPSFSSSSPISIDVSSLNVDTMVGVTGEAYAISNNVIAETLYFPVYKFANSYTAQIRFLTNTIQIYHERLNDYTSGILKILYTKSTDVAGSGSWTPQGVPTHHYSTDEQVIGTYLGDTLYEKTWTNLNVTMVISGGNWQEISDVDLTGVDVIVDSKVWRQGGTGLVKTNNVAEAGVSLNQKLQFSYFNSNFGGTIKVITLQYTKSS